MILIINTTKDEQTEIFLVSKKDNYVSKIIKGERRQAEKLLTGIEALMKQEKIDAKKIKAIGVVVGPGGFTSVRIGVVAANTLAFACKVKVIGIKAKEFNDEKELISKIYKQYKAKRGKVMVLPVYDREPNITTPKK